MDIEVYIIPVPKHQLRALPRQERVFLLLLGYCTNQVVLFQKLVAFSANNVSANPLEEKLSGANTQLILRHLVGVLSESYELIRTRFLSSPLGRDYRPLLDESGTAALTMLNQKFGAGSLLTRIRNGYAFHYPNDEELDAAFEKATTDSQWDDEWHWYFSHSRYNSFYFLSDFVTLHGLYGPTHSNPLIGHLALMAETGPVADGILDFAQAFVAAVWKRHFGQEMLALEKKTISEAPHWEDVRIPFFVQPDSASS